MGFILEFLNSPSNHIVCCLLLSPLPRIPREIFGEIKIGHITPMMKIFFWYADKLVINP